MLIIVHHLILTIEKNNFSVLDEGPTDDVNNSTDTTEKRFRINFSKAKTKFA